jgi:hypothetical protein
MINPSLRTILIIIIIIIPLLLIQAAWIFQDAKKRGYKHYWLWGLFGLINVPQSIIIYLIVTRIIMNKKSRN